MALFIPAPGYTLILHGNKSQILHEVASYLVLSPHQKLRITNLSYVYATLLKQVSGVVKIHSRKFNKRRLLLNLPVHLKFTVKLWGRIHACIWSIEIENVKNPRFSIENIVHRKFFFPALLWDRVGMVDGAEVDVYCGLARWNYFRFCLLLNRR